MSSSWSLLIRTDRPNQGIDPGACHASGIELVRGEMSVVFPFGIDDAGTVGRKFIANASRRKS